MQTIDLADDVPYTRDLPAHAPWLWEDVAEVAEAVMASASAPDGFVRREMPLGDGRANVYAGIARRDGTAPDTIVVVISPVPDTPAPPARGELARRFGLTPREAQVALLLAARRSNKEIARHLAIAQKTAARHTESILAKLNTSSRRDVARVLGWHGRPGDGGRRTQRERGRWRA
jgi:DNA-binding CsgD family transcriptional regulator